MIIGLLGGTFNPPHIGHFLMAQQVLDFTDCQAIWFVPSFKPSFNKPAATPEDRLSMTKLFVEDYLRELKDSEQMSVCSLEIDHMLNGETIELLSVLPEEHTYRFIIGSDQLPSFHLWGRWEELLNKLPFYVFPRLGYANEPLYRGMSMVNDASLIISNISSTKVRERIALHLTIQEFVPPKVSEYIKLHNLYLPAV